MCQPENFTDSRLRARIGEIFGLVAGHRPHAGPDMMCASSQLQETGLFGQIDLANMTYSMYREIA